MEVESEGSKRKHDENSLSINERIALLTGMGVDGVDDHLPTDSESDGKEPPSKKPASDDAHGTKSHKEPDDLSGNIDLTSCDPLARHAHIIPVNEELNFRPII